ncbi:zinc finger protein [Saccharopolyspora hattusasensis]|uniref:zinc finger protein n=1 Tax=Saccharopolyspora hattusasensis TaxID=1128679 RepID=UPI003D98FAEB
MYRPHPFSWVPADGQRHASIDARPGGGYPTGVCVATLCGHQLIADNTDRAWLWETCPDCNAAAHVLAEVPMPPAAGAR